ncbi:Protein ANTAGONIST OF LIKE HETEROCHROMATIN PROTEIN 1 [Frankliniella fusca]|uniref:Protein ANTAGONIST OF LIKE HETEROCHROMATIN PROTEIN 1 n=1 Tax=Frankliniella fusca TaxID=407009 RepID=A0AAE1HGE5_9NEOP|nr:Protein ANTAGONIST OF LIKE HETEROCHROMATIN PROTEIN 1 [Frankliniella fusca]
MDVRRKVIVAIAISESQKLLETVRCLRGVEDDDEEVLKEVRRMMGLLCSELRGTREKPVRTSGYVDQTVPRLQSNQFREHFRMVPEVFQDLENLLGPILAKQENLGRSIIPVRKQILCTLWLLATPDSYRSVGDRFDMGKASANDSFMRVVESLCSISWRIIRWPQEREVPGIKAKFFSISKMPDVIGAIDGSDIEIKAPQEEPQAYTNRKKRYAVILQAICNAGLRFVDCFAGYPGSVGDLRVLRNSPIYRRIREEEARLFPGNAYIIGDKIYPVLSWLIPSFRDNGALTQAHKN